MVLIKKYILSLFFLNKDRNAILDLVEGLGFKIEKHEITSVVDEYKLILPPTITELLNSGQPLDPEDKDVVPWLQYLKIEQYYDYLYENGAKELYTPLYYKWCRDATWISEEQNVRSLVNIFLFNEEPLESIVKIVAFKFRKRISQKALEIYQEIFWNTTGVTAREAVFRYIPFQNTVVIIKRLEGDYNTAESDIGTYATAEVVGGILDQDINWVKWKIGVKGIEVPTPEKFLTRVQGDVAMLYEEVMSSDNIREVKVTKNKCRTTVDGEGNMGSELYDETEISTKNTLDYKMNSMKKLTDLYVKAEVSMPKEGSTSTQQFFEKLKEIELTYTADYDAKIVELESNPEAFEDYLKATGGGEVEDV